MRTPSQCPGKRRLQDTAHAIPNYREHFRTTPQTARDYAPHTAPVLFWHWRMTQRYANRLFIKLLGALLGHKTRITQNCVPFPL